MTSNDTVNGSGDESNGDNNGVNAKKQFRMPDIIMKKRDGHVLLKDEIEFFVDGVVNKTIQQAQLGMLFFLSLLVFLLMPIIYEPCHEKTCLRGLRPGKTQTGLC